jgi:tetratricopeptide (TPR) repeat protein
MGYLTRLQTTTNRTIIPITIVLSMMMIVVAGGRLKILAQPYIPNPLETSVPDPLIPQINRPLSPFEQRRLREALDALNIEAKAQFDAGNGDAAFLLWYRELRLRRYLGRLEEIQALGRVGDIAWNNTRTDDVKNIYSRLQIVQQEAETEAPLTPELLDVFALAYQQLRKINESLYIELKILANAQAQGDITAQIKSLNTIGELHLSRFDYVKAAPIYEQLLDMAQSQEDVYQEGIYLQKLAEIYSEALQPENAVKIKEELVNNYLKNQQIAAIPELKILIGDDYDALKQAEAASQSYQEAYSLAWSLQQFGAAGKALLKLGDLYRKYQQDDYALQIYKTLIKVEQQSYNYYGLMNAYDRIGDIYLSHKNYSQALFSFQQGLELAKAISHNEEYFIKKITEVNQHMNTPQPGLELPEGLE